MEISDEKQKRRNVIELIFHVPLYHNWTVVVISQRLNAQLEESEQWPSLCCSNLDHVEFLGLNLSF